MRNLRLVTLAPEIVREYVGESTLVFDDENAWLGHGCNDVGGQGSQLLTSLPPAVSLPPKRAGKVRGLSFGHRDGGWLMANDGSFNQIDDVFGNVGRVIGDAF